MNLRPYQEVGRDFLASKTRALLADEMRVGKTPQAILAADAIAARSILVVCPAIALEHWKREFKKWSPNRPEALILSSRNDTHCVRRPEGFVRPPVLASYNMAAQRKDELRGLAWDVLIVDECHFAGNPMAARTRMIYGKEGIGWNAGHIWALSGTPAPKTAASLWPMLRAFGAIGMTYPAFVQRYCRVDFMSQRPVGTNEERIPELRKIMEPYVLRRTRAEVAPEMSAIGFEFLVVSPINAPKDIDVGADIMWHRDNASTAEYRIAAAYAKALPLVEEIAFAIDNALLKQTVVFGYHIDPLEAVVAGLRKRQIATELITGQTTRRDRELIQDSFRHGATQVLVANLLVAGTAIDLSAASHAYFLELDWVPANNVQAANRLVSMDKNTPVTCDVVTWPGSTDDRVQQVLTHRARELNQLYFLGKHA